MLLKFHEYIPEAYKVCSEAFHDQLEEISMPRLDEEDLYDRIARKWCGHLKLTFAKVPKYLTEVYTINGLVDPFSRKEVKWIKPLLKRRLGEANLEHISDEQISDLLSWVAIRYNFWLIQGLF